MARLPVNTIRRLHEVLAGDPALEGMILAFIADRYGARNLFYLKPRTAAAILAADLSCERAHPVKCVQNKTPTIARAREDIDFIREFC